MSGEKHPDRRNNMGNFLGEGCLAYLRVAKKECGTGEDVYGRVSDDEERMAEKYQIPKLFGVFVRTSVFTMSEMKSEVISAEERHMPTEKHFGSMMKMTEGRREARISDRKQLQ